MTKQLSKIDYAKNQLGESVREKRHQKLKWSVRIKETYVSVYMWVWQERLTRIFTKNFI